MRVPARVFADAELLAAIEQDHSLEQLANVATLPGIVDAALAMPDIHQGYGFPVGGVAATSARRRRDLARRGRLRHQLRRAPARAARLTFDELGGRREALVHEISRRVPVGTGGKGAREGVRGASLDRVLSLGPRALLDDLGIGSEEELHFTESGGCLDGADPAAVSPRARERGAGQIGTLGSGNHFLELQRVSEVTTSARLRAFGLRLGQVTVLIHSGSRGLGHQVCTDFVKRMDARLGHYGIELPDRQLSCAPMQSPEGQDYLRAMAAAANFAWANRAALAHRVRESVASVLGRQEAAGVTPGLRRRPQCGQARGACAAGSSACIAKGATRAFPPGHPEIPPEYAEVGQPVFIPGSMGTASFVLAGRAGAMERSFGTTCHGAGRRMSRTAVRKAVDGGALRRQLEADGIVVRAPSARGLAEEAPEAYKDVDRVVEIVERAGLAGRVVRLRPVGVVKG